MGKLAMSPVPLNMFYVHNTQGCFQVRGKMERSSKGEMVVQLSVKNLHSNDNKNIWNPLILEGAEFLYKRYVSLGPI